MTQRYYTPNLMEKSTLPLPDDEAKHAAVMRIQIGELIVCFDGMGHEVTAEIIAVNRREVIAMPTGDIRLVDRERKPEVHLAVALPKGDRQKFLIEKAVELGAARLTPILCQRSVVRPDAAAVQRMQRAVIEASKQCGRNQLMSVDPPTELISLLEQTPESIVRYIADPSSGDRFVKPADRPYCVLIGPEGGFTIEEVAKAESFRWTRIGLGPRILRIETAALAILAME